jgi:periplasmic iron binding protein
MFDKKAIAFALSGCLLTGSVSAAEFQIGEAVEKNGMEIGAVYLQAVKMVPMLPMTMDADIHLEADIHALKGNVHGFAEGDWIPYLEITYTINKVGSDWSTVNAFMPMVASDGAHYGRNIKLDGPGKYHITYQINPPPYNGFFRHEDKETGTAAWWKPFSLSWDMKYMGTGKKGGY